MHISIFLMICTIGLITYIIVRWSPVLAMKLLRLPIPNWFSAFPGLSFTVYPIWLQWKYDDSWQHKVEASRKQIEAWQQTPEFEEWTLWMYESLLNWFPWAKLVSDVDSFRSNLISFVLRPYWTTMETGGYAFAAVFIFIAILRLLRWIWKWMHGQKQRYHFLHYWVSEFLFTIAVFVVIAIGFRSGWMAKLQEKTENWTQSNLVLSKSESLKDLGKLLQDNMFLSVTIVIVLAYFGWNITMTIKEFLLKRRLTS